MGRDAYASRSADYWNSVRDLAAHQGYEQIERYNAALSDLLKKCREEHPGRYPLIGDAPDGIPYLKGWADPEPA